MCSAHTLTGGREDWPMSCWSPQWERRILRHSVLRDPAAVPQDVPAPPLGHAAISACLDCGLGPGLALACCWPLTLGALSELRSCRYRTAFVFWVTVCAYMGNFLLNSFHWSIVDWVNFFCTAKWFSYMYIFSFFFMFSIVVYYRILNTVPVLYRGTCLSILYVDMNIFKTWILHLRFFHFSAGKMMMGTQLLLLKKTTLWMISSIR